MDIKRPNRRRVLAGGVLIGASGLLGGVARALADATTARFSYRYSVGAAPGIVAARAVDWKKFGIDMEITRAPSGTVTRDQIVAGDVDFGTLTIVPFLTAAAAGAMVAIGVESFSGDTICIMSKSDLGLKTAAELRGRKIASKTGTGTDNAFRKKFLPSVGLTEKDVTIVNVQFNDQLAAVAGGSVDAMVGFEPFCSLGESQGILHRLGMMGEVDPVPVLLVASTEIVDRDPDLVVRFLRGWLSGVAMFKEAPLQVAEVVQNEFKSERREDNVTVDILEGIVTRMRVQPELTSVLQEEIKAFAVDLEREGKLRSTPDWSQVLRPDFLERAKA